MSKRKDDANLDSVPDKIQKKASTSQPQSKQSTKTLKNYFSVSNGKSFIVQPKYIQCNEKSTFLGIVVEREYIFFPFQNQNPHKKLRLLLLQVMLKQT